MGRNIGILPLGVVITAARNQFNHFDGRSKRFSEVVFGHLADVYPEASWLSFKVVSADRPLAHAALSALQWAGRFNGRDRGFEVFCADMADITNHPF